MKVGSVVALPAAVSPVDHDSVDQKVDSRSVYFEVAAAEHVLDFAQVDYPDVDFLVAASAAVAA